jgi:transcriptional regulator with XRE-family HTH domain
VRCEVKTGLAYITEVANKKSHEAVNERVAALLRSRRIALGLSMNVVAQRSGLSQQMVSYVERGMRNPTLETLLRICDVLDTPLENVIRRARKSVR